MDAGTTVLRCVLGHGGSWTWVLLWVLELGMGYNGC